MMYHKYSPLAIWLFLALPLPHAVWAGVISQDPSNPHLSCADAAVTSPISGENATSTRSDSTFLIERLLVPVSVDPDYQERPVTVFRPTPLNPGNEYALVLYFHGYGETNDATFVGGGTSGDLDTSEGSGTNNYVRIVQEAWLRVREEYKSARNWILVMVDGRNCMNGTFYIDSRYTGSLGQWAAQEIPDFLENHYGIHISTDPYLNATAGHSMGGYGALRLSQIYNPASGAGRVYGIAAVNNPPVSWIASAGLALHAPSENPRDAMGHFEYEFTGEIVGESYSEGGKYRWELHRATELIFAMSAVMDDDSWRPPTFNGVAAPCDPYGESIDFGLTPYGLINPSDLLDWMENDIANNVTKQPDLWHNSLIYFDGQTQGYDDEYYLQHNASYLAGALERINADGTESGREYIFFHSDFYPNPDDLDSYIDDPPAPGDQTHFYELTFRTYKAFRFIAENMNLESTDSRR